MAESAWKRRGQIQRAVFAVLKDHPDGLPSHLVIEEVAHRVRDGSAGRNGPGASEERERFSRLVNSSTTAPARAGWLEKDRGHWTLTEAGLRAYTKYPDPEAFAEEANRLYQASRKKPPQGVSWWRSPGNAVKGLVAIIAACTTLWTFGTWAYGKYESWRGGTLKGRVAAEQAMLDKLTATSTSASSPMRSGCSLRCAMPGHPAERARSHGPLNT